MGCGYLRQPGYGAYTHADAYREHPDVELAAICESDPQRRKAAQERLQTPLAVASVEALLAAGPFDMISVCTPDATHYDIARQILDGRLCRCLVLEKPAAQSEDEILDLIARERASGVRVAVNFSRRFARQYRDARAFLRAGHLGSLQAVHGFYAKGLLHSGSHWIDLFRFLTGEDLTLEAAEVVCEEMPDDPTIAVSGRASRGAVVNLCGRENAPSPIFELDLVGSLGRLRFAAPREAPSFSSELEGLEGPMAAHPSESMTATLVEEVVQVCIGERTEASSTLHEARAVHHLVARARRLAGTSARR